MRRTRRRIEKDCEVSGPHAGPWRHDRWIPPTTRRLERVADRISRLYGHEVELRPVEHATSFTEVGHFDLYLDGERVGSIQPWWSPEWPPEQVLADLANTIEEGWAQELRGGLWESGLPPAWGEDGRATGGRT